MNRFQCPSCEYCQQVIDTQADLLKRYCEANARLIRLAWMNFTLWLLLTATILVPRFL